MTERRYNHQSRFMDLRMRNPLQEQLLKAGLAKKGKVDQIARDQAKQRQGKAPTVTPEEKIDTQRLQAEKAERDRAIAAERNAQAQARELAAQVRQIIDANKVKREGEISYRFSDGEAIHSILVNKALRPLHGMRRRKQKYGMMTMCIGIGTGMGTAGVLEAL